MKRCVKCNQIAESNAKFCTNCGSEVVEDTIIPNSNVVIDDYPLFGVKVLSFLCPYIGLILYGFYSYTRPNAARSYKNWSLLALLLGLVSYILLVACSN